MKNKDFVFTDFLEMIKKSWTYEKLTEEEKGKIHCILLDSRTTENIKGKLQPTLASIKRFILCVFDNPRLYANRMERKRRKRQILT